MSTPPCHHVCRCGAELRCACEPDHCAAGVFWTCPTCEQAGFDTYISRLAEAQLNSQHAALTKETTHDEHQ